MRGEDGKLKGNSKQKTHAEGLRTHSTAKEATMESIVQLYERGELHQHYQCLASPSIDGDEFRRCFLRENPFSIYFLSQLIEEETGEMERKAPAASDVYELLTKKQQKRVINPRAYSKETFFDLFRFINSATEEQLKQYGHPAGLYFLARDVGAHPEQLYFFVGKKQKVQYLLGERVSELDWRPKRINMRISEIDAVCNFLGESYLQDREQFFNVYGSKAGCVLLACKLRISPKRLRTLLSTEVLTAIMGISDESREMSQAISRDEEFERRFNPHPVRLSLKQVEVVLDFLRSAYKADADAFFERYGSRLGMVYLANVLINNGVCKYIDLESLSSMLHDSEMLFLLLSHFPPEDKQIEEKLISRGKETISSRFRPLHIAFPLATVSAIFQFLKERYNEDADSFFARYGVEKGVLALAKDLEAEIGKKIRLSRLSTLISDGKELAKLLQIEDSRFGFDTQATQPGASSWNLPMLGKGGKGEKTYEKWSLFRLQTYKEIESHGIIPLISDSIEAYNKGSIGPNALVRRLYFSECLEKIKEIGIKIDSMPTLIGVLIAGGAFKKGEIAELNRAAGAFEIYLTLQANGLIDEFEVELEPYKEGKISAYALARRLYKDGILEKAKKIDRNVDSTRTIAFALIASGLLPEEKTMELAMVFSNLDLFLAIKESGKLSELHGFIESYKKGEKLFAKELLSSGILSSLQEIGHSVDSINSVVLALIAGGVLEEKNRVELSRCTGHLDLYRWLQKKGFLNELRGLIEAYKGGKLKEHAFVSKLYQSGILSKIEETKKDVDSIATLAWAIAVGEEIPKSKWTYLGWEASAFDLYRDIEKSGFTEELRPLTEAYNSGEISKYAFVRQLHQTSILSKIQGSGREVFSYVTLANALVSGGLIPHDRKSGLNWALSAFDIFMVLTEDQNISAYLQDYCDVLSAKIEQKEISPALYALHLSLLHDSVKEILKRNGRDINTNTFFRVLVSGGIIEGSLEYLIACAVGALNRAEALALRELYKSSDSFSDFYREMISNWNLLREELKSTYTKGAPPEKPFSNSYAWKIWSALSAMEATFAVPSLRRPSAKRGSATALSTGVE